MMKPPTVNYKKKTRWHDLSNVGSRRILGIVGNPCRRPASRKNN